MADPEGHYPGDAGLVFAAHNNHDERCGPPPHLRNTDNLGLYYGYFENRYGEQFVFTFDRGTGTGMVSGGDPGWGDPQTYTLGLLGEALRSARDLAAQVILRAARNETSLSCWYPPSGKSARSLSVSSGSAANCRVNSAECPM